MSLYRTYGPVTCTLDPEDSTLSGTPAHNNEDAFWYDDHGWVFGSTQVSGNGLSPVFICNLDGVYILRKPQSSVFGYGNFGYDYLTGKGTTVSGSTSLIFEPDLGVFRFSTGILLSPTSTTKFIRTPEGFYRQNGSFIQRAPLSATQDSDYVNEFQITSSPTMTTNGCISPGPDSTIFLCYPNALGTIIQYDYIAKTEVAVNPGRAFGADNRLTLGTAVRRTVYSPKFDCFMVVDGDGITADTISVYSRELIPSTLSTPTATPAVTAGVTSLISVTLSDDQGVGIAGRLIDWSITVGNGTLLDTQTTTDEDGIATTYYRAPITGGVNPTIQASLTY